jgi:division protein CdvB (Snf7/Vps24/ESCRT-III family)
LLEDFQEWPQPVVLTEALKGEIRRIAEDYGLDLEAVEKLIDENLIPEPILDLLTRAAT